MTIRNFLPGFGMRTVVALAVAAAVVVAALLAVGSPASAQSSSDGEEIWSATMTVGSITGAAGLGFHDRGDVNTDYGSLDDNTFTFDGTDYTVSIINDSPFNGGQRVLAVFPHPSDSEARSWTFHVGGEKFVLDDGVIVDDGALRGYQFRNIGRTSWSDNDEVAVKITALPIITIEAVTSTVEYGGNNNAAESTAEFRFTRTGGTANALSFKLNYNGIFSGESATRNFEAGQSSFSNFHWAVEVDNNGNPVCSFFWTVLSGDGYVVATPDTAFVTIEGPGTTCMATM